jgi:hypothetical protein
VLFRCVLLFPLERNRRCLCGHNSSMDKRSECQRVRTEMLINTGIRMMIGSSILIGIVLLTMFPTRVITLSFCLLCGALLTVVYAMDCLEGCRAFTRVDQKTRSPDENSARIDSAHNMLDWGRLMYYSGVVCLAVHLFVQCMDVTI